MKHVIVVLPERITLDKEELLTNVIKEKGQSHVHILDVRSHSVKLLCKYDYSGWGEGVFNTLREFSQACECKFDFDTSTNAAILRR